MTANHHPCFSCTLPDCDERDRRCGLKRALNIYHSLLKRKEPIPERVRVARNHAYNELYGERHREISAERYQKLKLARSEAERANV
ncbi:hypothetical protein ATY76_13315 [Rhizobium sp. R339]|uniref:hypothetical protein n=1 Tax=Rhizobium sp. R339 TaxID=1764273 RepID=UPI000B53147A|nr:hypothetical protein [Rhizobium sp. R339]OWV67904.1 hypothetical protein ATY76_13315 [Rhizobium sp. R339]